MDYGSLVSVSCEEGYKLIGDNVITCVKDREFSHEVEPHCQQSKNKLVTISRIKAQEKFKFQNFAQVILPEILPPLQITKLPHTDKAEKSEYDRRHFQKRAAAFR